MNITIFAIFKDKAKFFIRVANGFEGEHNVTFITTRYHSYRIIKQAGYKVHMLQEFIKDEINIDEFQSFEDEAILMDVKAGFLSEKRAKKQFGLLAKGFKNYFATQKVDKFILWNGSMLQGFTASIVADSFKLKKLFFEVGNFPNKIFVDEKGVNAKSSLMDRDLTVCENYDEEKILNFLEEHKRSKETVHIVPQAVKKRNFNTHLVFDLIYNIFSKYPIVESDKSTFSKIKNKIFSKKFEFNYDNIDYKNESYILFPLQVSIDSQILRNSDIGLKEAIEIALDEAKKENLKLLIKPHPAEQNEDIIKYIESIKKDNENVLLVNENTYLLIKHSQKVITINSTVGIESLMYYKPTIILGRAFYKKYCSRIFVNKNDTQVFLYQYLFNILNNGNYFNNGNKYKCIKN